jgi:putative ABC transport system permease protein
MHRWLQNFAYQIPMNGWIFILAGLLILFIALFTVNGQIITVARKNPAEILRYE